MHPSRAAFLLLAVVCAVSFLGPVRALDDSHALLEREIDAAVAKHGKSSHASEHDLETELVQVRTRATLADKIMESSQDRVSLNARTHVVVVTILSEGYQLVSALYDSFIRQQRATFILAAVRSLFRQIQHLDIQSKVDRNIKTSLNDNPEAVESVLKELVDFKNSWFTRESSLQVISSKVMALASSISGISHEVTDARVTRLQLMVETLVGKLYPTREKQDKFRSHIASMVKAKDAKAQRLREKMGMQGYKTTPWQTKGPFEDNTELAREQNRFFYVCTHHVESVYPKGVKPPESTGLRLFGGMSQRERCQNIIESSLSPLEEPIQMIETFCYRLWKDVTFEDKSIDADSPVAELRRVKDAGTRTQPIEIVSASAEEDTSQTGVLKIAHRISDSEEETSTSPLHSSVIDEIVRSTKMTGSTTVAEAGYRRCAAEVNRMRFADGDPEQKIMGVHTVVVPPLRP